MSDFKRIKLKYLANLYTGNSIPDDLKDKFTNKEIPYIPTKELDVTTGTINYENGLSVSPEDGFKIAPPFSTLMCIEGGSAGKKIGLTDRKVAFVNKLCCLKSESIDDRLLYYCLQSKDFTEQFFLNMTGLIGGVSVATLKNLCITINRNSEYQVEIADKIELETDKIDNLIANQEAQIKKLKQYKQSLITEVVTKGLNPDAEMKDSDIEWIGEIPQHWSSLRVKNIGLTQNGISKAGEFFGSGYPFVSYSDVYKNIKLPNQVNGLIESTDEERKNYSVKKGDIFFTRTSETIDEVGFSSVCTNTIEGATFAGFLIRLRPFKDILISDYAKYYFRGSHIRRFLVKEMNIVTRASLGQSLLKAMPVLVPPTEEQLSMATYLDEQCSKIDKLIEIKQAKIAKLNEYKKSLIYEYVTGKKEVV